MIPSERCYDFIKQREGFSQTAYLDSAGIPTIGYGTILYENGYPVKMGDKITREAANRLFELQVDNKAKTVSKAIEATKLTQNQFDALVSFTYNVGEGALRQSTLLKKVLANPDDPEIRSAFLMWNKATVHGKKVIIEGLTNRRKAEADLYFS